MYTYLLIAATGEGKTTLVRKLIAKHPYIIYDINGEYREVSNDTTQPRSKFFGNPVEFIDICANKHNGTFCVFEDATGFLSGNVGNQMKSFIVAKRHPIEKGGRNIVLLFHTINSVPPFLLDTADYIVLFKTGDDISAVKKKRAKLVPYFQRLQTLPKYSKFIIKNR